MITARIRVMKFSEEQKGTPCGLRILVRGRVAQTLEAFPVQRFWVARASSVPIFPVPWNGSRPVTARYSTQPRSATPKQVFERIG
jgi:hypothetical protein